MAIRLHNIQLNPDEPESELRERAAVKLFAALEDITHLSIVKRSLDARGGGVRFVYSIDVALADAAAERDAVTKGLAKEAEPIEEIIIRPGGEAVRGRVVVAGCGPAGLFAALLLAEHGYRPLLVERGEAADRRHVDCGEFLANRRLNPESNFLFGAGGAGTYSDGKLYTRIRDPRARGILEQMVAAGAPPEILYEGKPHVGTDVLHVVIAALCERLLALGGEIQWRTRLVELSKGPAGLKGVRTTSGEIETNALLLAPGASARDTFRELLACGLAMEAKPFQMGVRVEHPRELIDKAILGKWAGHANVGAADYVLSEESVAAFCVCPGGTLVAAACESETICTNGMSNGARNSPFTNAALVTTIEPMETGGAPLDGVEFQRRWERDAFRLAGGDYTAPGQSVTDFLKCRLGGELLETSYPFGIRPVRMERLLPPKVSAAIARALPLFNRRIRGFAGDSAVLIGPETRASCPVRMPRDAVTRVSTGINGVYPVGEGSGYSSGIMSSAVDGVKSAEAIIARFAPMI